MFNPNGTFKWSVNLATMIYSSDPEANTTWEYICPQICKYLEEEGKTYTLTDMADRHIFKIGSLEDLTVMTVGDTVGVTFMALTPFTKRIIDDAYDNKMIFGLPVAATFLSDEMTNRIIITFMSRETWESLNSPRARELDRILGNIDRQWGGNNDDDIW